MQARRKTAPQVWRVSVCRSERPEPVKEATGPTETLSDRERVAAVVEIAAASIRLAGLVAGMRRRRPWWKRLLGN